MYKFLPHDDEEIKREKLSHSFLCNTKSSDTGLLSVEDYDRLACSRFHCEMPLIKA